MTGPGGAARRRPARARCSLRELILEGELRGGERVSESAARRTPRRLAHAAAAGAGPARARGPARGRRRVAASRSRLVHARGGHRRDRPARRARGRRGPAGRRARARPATGSRRCTAASPSSTPSSGPDRPDDRGVRALRGAQRALPHAAAGTGGQPRAGAALRSGCWRCPSPRRARSCACRPSCPSRTGPATSPRASTASMLEAIEAAGGDAGGGAGARARPRWPSATSTRAPGQQRDGAPAGRALIALERWPVRVSTSAPRRARDRDVARDVRLIEIEPDAGARAYPTGSHLDIAVVVDELPDIRSLLAGRRATRRRRLSHRREGGRGQPRRLEVRARARGRNPCRGLRAARATSSCSTAGPSTCWWPAASGSRRWSGMAHALVRPGAPFRLLYAARTREQMPFVDELGELLGDRPGAVRLRRGTPAGPRRGDRPSAPRRRAVPVRPGAPARRRPAGWREQRRRPDRLQFETFASGGRFAPERFVVRVERARRPGWPCAATARCWTRSGTPAWT